MALVIALFCIVFHFAELESSLAGEWRIADQPNLMQLRNTGHTEEASTIAHATVKCVCAKN